MSTEPGTPARQSRLTDDFFYFFLRLRKGRIRKVVADINARFPEESVEQRARRLIEDQAQLSFLSGLILDLPTMVPGIGQALKILGFVGGTSALLRMHLYLILEIALLYGKDIDDQARVPEMVAVVAGTGLAVGTPLLADALGLHPLWSMATGGMAAVTMSHLIGESAIRYYSQPQEAPGDTAPAASI
ncbi:MAG: hypothetical protein AB1491_01490 [Thermodesulfobacteriota bacterium]